MDVESGGKKASKPQKKAQLLFLKSLGVEWICLSVLAPVYPVYPVPRLGLVLFTFLPEWMLYVADLIRSTEYSIDG